MKFKTTQKSVKGGYRKVYQAGYCALSHLLKYRTPVAYTCGVYGWNCDVYQFGTIAITTGYRPFGEKIGFEKIRAFENKAWEIIENSQLTFDDKEEKVNEVLEEFLQELY